LSVKNLFQRKVIVKCKGLGAKLSGVKSFNVDLRDSIGELELEFFVNAVDLLYPCHFIIG
jgi:hypothetical protein